MRPEDSIDDLKYLSGFFGWDDEDKKNIWIETKKNDDIRLYWYRLAYAYRRGYRQTKENGYMRLCEWEMQQTREQS